MRGSPVPVYLLGLPEPWGLLVRIDRVLAVEAYSADTSRLEVALDVFARCLRAVADPDVPDPYEVWGDAEPEWIRENYDYVHEALCHRFPRFDDVTWPALEAYLRDWLPRLFPDLRITAGLIRECGQLWVIGSVFSVLRSLYGWLERNRDVLLAAPSITGRLFAIIRDAVHGVGDLDTVQDLFNLALRIDQERARVILQEAADDEVLPEEYRIQAQDRLDDLDELG